MFVSRNVRMKYMAPAGDNEGGGGQISAEAAAAALAATVAANAAAVEAEAAAAALAAGGVKKPSDEEARLLKENMKKKADLVTAATELAKLQGQLKAFEGIDPEAVRKLLGEQRSAEEAQLLAKGDFERLKARMAEEHGKETTALKAQLAELQSSLGKASGAINELSIGTQFGQSKFITEDMTMTPSKAKIVYASHFDLEDGKVVGYDKPRGDAKRTALVDQYGNAVGFDDAMRKIVEADPEKEDLLRSKVKPGAGSDSKKTTPVVPGASTDSMSKISAGLKSIKAG